MKVDTTVTFFKEKSFRHRVMEGVSIKVECWFSDILILLYNLANQFYWKKTFSQVYVIERVKNERHNACHTGWEQGCEPCNTLNVSGTEESTGTWINQGIHSRGKVLKQKAGWHSTEKATETKKRYGVFIPLYFGHMHQYEDGHNDCSLMDIFKRPSSVKALLCSRLTFCPSRSFASPAQYYPVREKIMEPTYDQPKSKIVFFPPRSISVDVHALLSRHASW
jgi:hypothetical protein